MMSGRMWEWLNAPSPGLSSFFTSTAGLMSSSAADINIASASVPLVWPSFGEEGEVSDVSSFITSGTSDLGVCTGDSFSAVPSSLFTLDTGSGMSWQILISSGSRAVSVDGSAVGSSSESEPDAELLSEEDFLSCFSSFFLFFFFFLPACLLCFLDLESPSTRSEAADFLLSPFDTALCVAPAAAARRALARVVLTGCGGVGSLSDSPDSELLSFSPFFLLFFFLLLCFLCFLLFLCVNSFSTLESPFSRDSSSPDGTSTVSMAAALFLRSLSPVFLSSPSPAPERVQGSEKNNCPQQRLQTAETLS